MQPLYSEYLGDEEMADLIEFFVAEMRDRVNDLEAALQSGDETLLREMAHQLKGAAASYGFPSITQVAGELERSLLAEEAEVSALTEQVEGLIDMCRRAAAGG